MQRRHTTGRARVIAAVVGMITVVCGAQITPVAADAPTGLGGPVTSAPSCIAADGQYLRCFVRNSTNHISYRVRNPLGVWTDWSEIPSTATFAGKPECVGRGGYDFSCYGRSNTTSGFVELYYDTNAGGVWREWDYGGPIASDPVCFARRERASDAAASTTDCFVLNSSGNIVRISRAGGYGMSLNWMNLGATVTSRPSCWSGDGINKVDCVVVTNGGEMWRRSSVDGGANWGGWTFGASGLKGDPSCVSWKTGNVDCFALGASDNSLRHIYWTSATAGAGWENLGGSWTSSPSCTVTHALDLGCVQRGTDNLMYGKLWNSESGWQPWLYSGQSSAGGVSCSGEIRNEYDCAGSDPDGNAFVWRIGNVGPTLADISQVSTHNAYANYVDSRWTSPNQSQGMIDQLNHGVRSLMLDTHWYDGSSTALCIISFGSDCYPPGVYLCHGDCSAFAGVTYALPRQTLTGTMQAIVNWMNANPNAVVTIFLEDYTTPDQLRGSLGAVGGLSAIQFDPQQWNVQTRGWPSMREMRAANKRLMVMSNAAGRESFGVVKDSDYTVQNYWSIGDNGDQLSCYSRWASVPLDQYEPGFKRLFVMTHVRNVPTAITAALDNGAKLRDRINNQCTPAAGRKPNFIGVDFYEVPGSAPNPYSIAAALTSG